MNPQHFSFLYPECDFPDQCIDYSQNYGEPACNSPSLKPSNLEPDFPKETNDSTMSQLIEETENFMNPPWFESYEEVQTLTQNFFSQTSVFYNNSPEKNEECTRQFNQAIEEEKSPEGFIAAKMLSMSSLGNSQTQKDFEFINDHTMEIEEQQFKQFALSSFAKGESSQRSQFLTPFPEQQTPSSVDDSSTTSKSEQNIKKNLPVTTVFAVVSSLKKVLQSGSWPEEQLYLRSIVFTFFPSHPERQQFLDYLEGCKAGKSGRTWNKLKEQFTGKNVDMNSVLMRCVEAFLSTEGERDLEKYFKEGKMKKAAKDALRNEKTWFIQKLKETFPAEFAD